MVTKDKKYTHISKEQYKKALEDFINFLKEEKKWVTLSRIQITKRLGLPFETTAVSIGTKIIVHPNILVRYKIIANEPALRTMYKYTDNMLEKVNSISYSIRYIPKEERDGYLLKIKDYYQKDYIGFIYAVRILDLLWKRIKKDWAAINYMTLQRSSQIPKKILVKTINELEAMEILLKLKDEYIISSGDPIIDKKIKLDAMQKENSIILQKNSENTNFDYLTQLIPLLSEINNIKNFSEKIAVSSSKIVVMTTLLKEKDAELKNMSVAFERLSEEYKKNLEENKKLNEKLLHANSILKDFDENILSGSAMRSLLELKKITEKK